METFSKKMTPMLRQYHQLKKGVPKNVLLLFRMGDFYELFYDDAGTASKILNIALTKRNEVPMCGVPHHSAESYISKLIQAGQKVAIAEQTSEPIPGKLVEREISGIITAGTISVNFDALLDKKKPNYIAAVSANKKTFGMAYAELTTCAFYVIEFAQKSEVLDELARIQPAEVIVSENQLEDFADISAKVSCDSHLFQPEYAQTQLCEHFKVNNLDGFGCSQMTSAIACAGALVTYVSEQLRRDISNIKKIEPVFNENYVQIDSASQRNLDLIDTFSNQSATRSFSNSTVSIGLTNRYQLQNQSLFSALDRTATSLGARELRRWVLRPLLDLGEICERQDFIEILVKDSFLLEDFFHNLNQIRDLERLIAKISGSHCNARDVLALGKSLAILPELVKTLKKFPQDNNLAKAISDKIFDFAELTHDILQAIVEIPPNSTKEGGMIKAGWDAKLDELRTVANRGQDWIVNLQNTERDKTGIKSLKVKYNQVFGYFIEVTKPNVPLVPEDYIRKQTMVNAERFITPELKEMENQILGSNDRANALELEIFLQIKNRIVAKTAEIQTTAQALAKLDALCSLAETARLFGYVRPKVNDSELIYIADGRHPVLDQNLLGEKFVPNDTLIDTKVQRLNLITGPNMAGKSTYLRQVALMVLMAQMGSFVPASKAEIGLVDKIFTRVGASDDIARGQSTFMVEMTETASIVNTATSRSLVILDEIGRGTATFDGLSLAWSIAEYLHDKIMARTLFATHYHELTELVDGLECGKNFCVAVKEWQEEIIFLRKIIAGTADRSYGIQVAKLAGLPEEIINKAKKILVHLENGEHLLNRKKSDAETENAIENSENLSKDNILASVAEDNKNDDEQMVQAELF